MMLVRWGELLVLLRPHLTAVALISARLVPVAFLCPLLGGATAPQSVKLGVVLSLALGIHIAGAVAPLQLVETSWELGGLAARELVFGVVLGLVAGLPFDSARLGGRLVDLFRGTSAEAVLPQTGTRESATGDGLYQLLTALAMSGIGLPLVLSALWRSFGAVRLGAFAVSEGALSSVLHLALAAVAGGLAIGAPIAAVTLGVDCVLGLVSRAAPQLQLQESGAPIKILGGAAALWLCLGVISDKALDAVVHASGALSAIAGSLP